MTLREQYLAILQIRELMPNTIETYMSLFDSFMRHCESINTKPENVLPEQIIFYLSQIKSESTRMQAKGTLTNLYTFVLHQAFKTMGIPNPKRHYHAVDYLSLTELNSIFNQVKNTKQITILKLQYACALRGSEVCNIKKKDFIKKFDIHSKWHIYDLRICGKGGHTDIIPVPQETIAEIRNYYLNYLSEKERQSEYLFPGQFKDGYSIGTVQKIIRKAMYNLGISKEGNHSSHLMRISRGTHLLLAGVDISFVQKLLRHKNIKTTQRYYNGVKTDDLRVVFSGADTFLKESLSTELNLLNQQKQIKAA